MSVRQQAMFGTALDDQFDAFVRDNPQVYEAMVRLARQAKDAGRTRIGAKALWERMRWDMWIATGQTPRLNNNMVSRMARLIAEREPDLADLFEFRELRS